MQGLTTEIPAGLAPFTLTPAAGWLGGARRPTAEAGQGLRAVVLVRPEPDPVGGRLISLRQSLDCAVYLAAVLDDAGRVTAWCELCVQDVDLAASGAAETGGGLSNGLLDRRWERTQDALDVCEPESLIRLGFERRPMPAVGLDPEAGVLRRPMHEPTGTLWDVCRDERVLAERGLPGYAASLHRYLWVEKLGQESPLAAVTAGAPPGDQSIADILTGVNRAITPFNLAGGRAYLRRLCPVTLADHISVLGGADWSGVTHGTRAIDLRDGTERAASAGAGETALLDPDRLFLGRHGRWGRLVETLHLKLRLIAQCVDAARAAVAHTRRPLLNLTDESFRVELWDGGVGMPRLWTARARLVDPGVGVAVPLGEPEGGGRGEDFFLAPGGIGSGIYRPELSADVISGRCALRLREVVVGEDGRVSMEGTLTTDERVRADGSEIAVLTLRLGDRRVAVRGRLLAEPSLASGELRLRTHREQMDAASAEAARAAEGVPMRDVPFELVPRVSTPVDLHALAVLAVKALLAGRERTLAVALDEVLSLARRVGAEDTATPLADRIERAFMSDDRWIASLGPHHLTAEPVAPLEALDMVPPELWFGVLAAVVRMLCGAGPDSEARDLGDTRGRAPHLVFDRAAEDLAELLTRTRSLVVIDWRHNREVHAVLRRFRTGMDKAEERGMPRLV